MFIISKLFGGRSGGMRYLGWDRCMFVWLIDRNKAKKFQTRKEAENTASYYQDARVEWE